MVTWGHGANKERPGGPEARWTRERQGSKGNRRPEGWLGAKSAVQRCNCGGAACKSAKVSAEEPRGGTGRTWRGPEAQRLGGPERGRAQRGIGDRIVGGGFILGWQVAASGDGWREKVGACGSRARG
jgi:hypothetical protein